MRKIYIRKNLTNLQPYTRVVGFTFKKNIQIGQTGIVWIREEIVWNNKFKRRWHLKHIQVYNTNKKYVLADIIE